MNPRSSCEGVKGWHGISAKHCLSEVIPRTVRSCMYVVQAYNLMSRLNAVCTANAMECLRIRCAAASLGIFMPRLRPSMLETGAQSLGVSRSAPVEGVVSQCCAKRGSCAARRRAETEKTKECGMRPNLEGATPNLALRASGRWRPIGWRVWCAAIQTSSWRGKRAVNATPVHWFCRLKVCLTGATGGSLVH